MSRHYTLAELNAATDLSQIAGKAKTGATDSIRSKRVTLAQSEVYGEAVVVSYGGGPLCVIDEPAKRDQFIHRGC